jgi:hypothetical protein
LFFIGFADFTFILQVRCGEIFVGILPVMRLFTSETLLRTDFISFRSGMSEDDLMPGTPARGHPAPGDLAQAIILKI